MTVYAEENTRTNQEYVTRGGIATMGTGSASITIEGQAGQTLVGKRFNVYKLFYAENARDGESINYTFNPLYEQEDTACSVTSWKIFGMKSRH